jgi:membrane-bound lytic murein transglycosylase D
MLQNKAGRIFLSMISFLLLSATASNIKSNRNHQQNAIHELTVADTHEHYFDANGLCSCLHDLANNDDAPKMQLNAKTMKFVKAYLKKNSSGLEKIRLRTADYFPMMEEVFCNYDLPQELKYLSVIESDLKHRAVSKAGAAGLWQMMPSTAKQMGIKIGKRYDERMLKRKSTEAAARYLNNLHHKFGDWLLTIAAYNGGPGAVYKAIRYSHSRNFWKLQQYLPAETRDYVKRYISMHYYFEGHAGLTTITKDELLNHIQAVHAYSEKNEFKGAVAAK